MWPATRAHGGDVLIPVPMLPHALRTPCGRGRDTRGALPAPARVHPQTTQLRPPRRARPCGPRPPPPGRWEGGRRRGAAPADASRRRWDRHQTVPRCDRHAWAAAPGHTNGGQGVRDRAAPARQTPVRVPCAPPARGAGQEAQGATVWHGQAKAGGRGSWPIQPPRSVPRRSVATWDRGPTAGRTTNDPDTGGGGTLAPLSARLPPHARRAEPNARGEPRPTATARHERRLLGVGSSAMLGAVSVRGYEANASSTPVFPLCVNPKQPNV